MAKESLYAPIKAPIFRETFADEQTTRVLGGVPASVVYSNGVGTFNGTTSNILYPKSPNGTCSIRFKCTPNNFTGDPVLLYTTSGSRYIYFTVTTGIIAVSSGTVYVNGVATTTTVVGVSNDIVVTGISLNGDSFYAGKNGIASSNFLNGSVELFEIYDYTLTANEVANMYVNKRYDDLQLDTFENLYTSSEDFSTWTTLQNTITTNQITAPDGTLTADKVTINSTAAYSYVTQISQRQPNNTVSFYVKYGTQNFVQIVGPGAIYANFDIQNGVLGNSSGCTAGITTEANGFYRISIIFTSATPYIDDYFFISPITSLTSARAEVTTISGTYYYLWGGSLTNSSFIKPYFKTTTTRKNSLTEILNIDAKNGVIANKWNTTLTNTAVTPVRAGNIWDMNFNGSTSKLDCGSYDTLVGDKSVIFWLKNRNIASSFLSFIITNGSFLIAIDNGTWYISNGILVSSDGGFSAPSGYSANNIIKPFVPIMIAVTRTSAGVVNIYANGVLTGSANQTSGTPVAGSTNITIGQSSGGSGVLNGNLSGIRIIDGILTAQEVSALWSSERKNYNV